MNRRHNISHRLTLKVQWSTFYWYTSNGCSSVESLINEYAYACLSLKKEWLTEDHVILLIKHGAQIKNRKLQQFLYHLPTQFETEWEVPHGVYWLKLGTVIFTCRQTDQVAIPRKTPYTEVKKLIIVKQSHVIVCSCRFYCFINILFPVL